MDSLSLSLDDIIKKNKKFKPKNDRLKKGVKVGKIVKKTNVIKKKSITPNKNLDARMKIIQKNRRKIQDAREKIALNARKTIKDARELLSSKKPPVVKKKPNIPRAKIPRSRGAHLTMDDDLLMDDDDIELDDLDKFKTKPIGSLRRTVQNDIYNRSSSPPPLRGMPKLPTFSIQNRDVSPTIDPFDCYVVPTRRPVPLPPRNIPERYRPGKIMSAHMDSYVKDSPARKSILRTSSRNDDHDDRFESDRYVTAEPKSRYRESNESAGIFAKTSSPPRSSSSLIKGHRIIVSNLDETVLESEMKELFSEIGEVMSSKIIRPGTAEIIFRYEGDDERAHELYHNRMLDGQPMKIILAGPTSKSAAYYRM